MKLRNKKTDEIVDTLCRDDITKGLAFGVDWHDGNPTMVFYNSLAELNEEWEDVPEEPKDFWHIDDFMIMCGTEGEFTKPDLGSFTKKDIEKLKAIGNYFETKEEAEKAIEKLKAWKRLKDLGFKCSYHSSGYHRGTFTADFIFDEDKLPIMDTFVAKDLDLLFGGEE